MFVILETHLIGKYSFCYLCCTDTVYITLQKKLQLIAAYRTGTIRPHPFICSGEIAGKEKLDQAGKDYNNKIAFFGMYIFQWFQQNTVMYIYSYWDCLNFFSSHLMILMKFRDRKTRTMWEV